MKAKTNHTEKKKIKNTPIIMCVGVGGGGSNAINYMYHRGIKDVAFMVANTDKQALQDSPVATKLQLGPHTTHGLGAGANPMIGANAALESQEEINKIFPENIKSIFITAGMGGGTGTGAAPIIANIAREKGLLVVGIVTTPFLFEGKKKQQSAEEGVHKLQEKCDVLIIIENERLMQQADNATKLLSLRSAFELVDQVLYNAVTSITDPINEPGIINVDFCDIDTMLRNAGSAVIGTGFAEGEGRALKAIQQAMYSPLLRNATIKGSTRLLLSVASGTEDGEFTLSELAQVTEYLKKILENDDVMVIWGHAHEKNLGKKIRISVIASGFPQDGLLVQMPVSIADKNLHEVRSMEDRISLDSGIKTTKGVQEEGAFNKKQILEKPKRAAEKKLERKVETWRQNAEHYVQNTAVDDTYSFTDKEIQEILSIPSYKRKNIFLVYKSLNQNPPIRHFLKENKEDIVVHDM